MLAAVGKNIAPSRLYAWDYWFVRYQMRLWLKSLSSKARDLGLGKQKNSPNRSRDFCFNWPQKTQALNKSHTENIEHRRIDHRKLRWSFWKRS